MLALADRCKRRPGRDREQTRQEIGSQADRLSISSRVRDEEQDAGSAAVLELERDASKLTLHVNDPGLGFDRQVAHPAYRVRIRQTAHHPVPGALVTQTDLDFGVKARTIGELSLETPQQSDLSSVPDRIGTGIRSDPDIESDDRSQPGELVDARVPDLGALESAHLGRREPGRGRHLADGASQHASREPQLRTDSDEIGMRDSSATIAGPFARRHDRHGDDRLVSGPDLRHIRRCTGTTG